MINTIGAYVIPKSVTIGARHNVYELCLEKNGPTKIDLLSHIHKKN